MDIGLPADLVRGMVVRYRDGKLAYRLLALTVRGDAAPVYDILIEELAGTGIPVLTDPVGPEADAREREVFALNVVHGSEPRCVVVTQDYGGFIDRLPRKVLDLALIVPVEGM